MDESETDEVRALLRAYADSLPFELDFQGFERELAELPGAYAPPRGALLVAHGAGGSPAASHCARSRTTCAR